MKMTKAITPMAKLMQQFKALSFLVNSFTAKKNHNRPGSNKPHNLTSADAHDFSFEFSDLQCSKSIFFSFSYQKQPLLTSVLITEELTNVWRRSPLLTYDQFKPMLNNLIKKLKETPIQNLNFNDFYDEVNSAFKLEPVIQGSIDIALISSLKDAYINPSTQKQKLDSLTNQAEAELSLMDEYHELNRLELKIKDLRIKVSNKQTQINSKLNISNEKSNYMGALREKNRLKAIVAKKRKSATLSF